MMLAMHNSAGEESQLSQTSLFSSEVSNSMELFSQPNNFSQPNSSQSQSQTTAGTLPAVAMVTVTYVT